jgi:hypothetical protein
VKADQTPKIRLVATTRSPVLPAKFFCHPNIESVEVSPVRTQAAVLALHIRVSGWGRVSALSPDRRDWRVQSLHSFAACNEFVLLAPKGVTVHLAYRNLWGRDQLTLQLPASSSGIGLLPDVTQAWRQARLSVTLPAIRRLRPVFRDRLAPSRLRVPQPRFASALMRVPDTRSLFSATGNPSAATLFQEQFQESIKGDHQDD